MEECFNKLRQKKVKHEAPYLRSHFAVYRSDLIRQYTNGFYDGLSAGKMLHLKLAAAGFELLFLSPEELSRFVCHLNHATMILNPARNDRKTGKAPARKKLSKKMRLFMDILDSEDLDL